MTDNSNQTDETPEAKQPQRALDGLWQFMTDAINDVDEEAAARRVQRLAKARPRASTEELVEVLVKQKCMQTGAVGLITSGAAAVPGLGTLVALTFGVAADIAWTFKLQAELVLEIAALYKHKLGPADKRNTVLLVTGISAGANQVLRKAGQRIAEEVSERLAEKSITKAIPVIGVAASAGSNILFTYVIGQRAQAYFSLGPAAVGDWGESLRAVTGMDERKITGWLAETTERSWSLVRRSVHNGAGAVIVAGKSAGEVVAVTAGKAGEAVAGVGRGIAEGVSTGAGAVADWGKRAGDDMASGVKKAGETVSGTGRRTRTAIASRARKARDTISGAGRRVGAGVAGVRKRVARPFKALKRKKRAGEEEQPAEEAEPSTAGTDKPE